MANKTGLGRGLDALFGDNYKASDDKGKEDNEKEVILLRYYKGKTQMQVAKILGITQVQVSRIERKVLDNMKRKLTV